MNTRNDDDEDERRKCMAKEGEVVRRPMIMMDAATQVAVMNRPGPLPYTQEQRRAAADAVESALKLSM